MTPYYSDRYTTIYHGDAREVMRQIDPVDLVLTDPPYGVLPLKWDTFTEQGFAVFNASWISQAATLAPRCCVFSGSTRSGIEDMLRLMFRNVRRLVWDKGTSGTGGGVFWYVFEEVYLCDNEQPKEFANPKFLEVADILKRAREAAGLSRGAVDMAVRGKKTGLCYRWEEGACLPTDEQSDILTPLLKLESFGYLDAIEKAEADRDDVLEAMRKHSEENGARFSDVLGFPVSKVSDHPCEKPIGLLSTLIDALNPSTILDPFMGAGTTLRAAKDRGRKAIGIDSDEAWCEFSAKRMAQEVLAL